MDKQISNFTKIIKKLFTSKEELSLEEPVDWIFLSQIARKHNILPLFFEAANNIEGYKKSSVYRKDQEDTLGIVAVQIQRTSAFLDIYQKISEAGIYPIVMKGIVCRQLYGELGEHRPSGDEDIFIEVKDFPRVMEILEREHYRCDCQEITESVLEQIQEVSFCNAEYGLTLEVHTNAIGKENKDRVQMNRFFQDVHKHGQIIRIHGTDMKVMEPTETLLFLILHAYKHLKNKGVGVRQAMDILLYYREQKQVISKEYLEEALKMCKAELFWKDIQYIGNQHLGLCEEMPEFTCSPEALMQDMMDAGVFGGQDHTDQVASRVNWAEEDMGRKGSKVGIILRAAFPARHRLAAGYPYLVEKPWLLPYVWVKRWMKFARYAGKDVWKVSSEILQKSSARMELIRKYKK